MNSVILIGRLTRDPELVYTPGNQTAVTHFSIAVDRPTAQGKERQADFIRITTFGKQAENCDRYLHKGKQVAVNGTGSYKNKEGQTIYTTDVIANNVEFLGSSQQGTPRQPDEAYSDSAPNYQDEMPDAFEATEEDIPF